MYKTLHKCDVCSKEISNISNTQWFSLRKDISMSRFFDFCTMRCLKKFISTNHKKNKWIEVEKLP